jgi:hypothetical protein
MKHHACRDGEHREQTHRGACLHAEQVTAASVTLSSPNRKERSVADEDEHVGDVLFAAIGADVAAAKKVAEDGAASVAPQFAATARDLAETVHAIGLKAR